MPVGIDTENYDISMGTGALYAGVISNKNSTTTGYSSMKVGGNSFTGYVDFNTFNGTRAGYIGYASNNSTTGIPNGPINLWADVGSGCPGFIINGKVGIGGVTDPAGPLTLNGTMTVTNSATPNATSAGEFQCIQLAYVGSGTTGYGTIQTVNPGSTYTPLKLCPYGSAVTQGAIVITASGTYNLTIDSISNVIIVYATGNLTLTVPSMATLKGLVMYIRRGSNPTPYTITMTNPSSGSIIPYNGVGGLSSITLLPPSNYSTMLVCPDGSNLFQMFLQ